MLDENHTQQDDIRPFAAEAVIRLSRDMVKAVNDLTDQEARFLVDSYYTMQENRKASGNQIRALNESGEPHTVLDWWHKQCATMEQQVERALDAWTYCYPVGRWLRSVHGIGPVLAANFLAHFDVRKSETAGGFWRFAGLDPSQTWEKGQKRPWNAQAKVACWKAGDSWVKLGERKDAFYAVMYRERKALEIARNERDEHRDYALARATSVGKTTEARKHYEAGRLPPAQVDARARRWAVKLFLAHLHHVMYECEHGRPPPKPYAVEHQGHAHIIGPWNWPMDGGDQQQDAAA